MTPVTRKVRVKVPATSANLGSGFDTVGLALDYHDELEFTLSADPVNTAAQVMIEGEGEDTLPRDETHLVVSTFRRACQTFGLGRVGFILQAHNNIPQARGMGSSAEAIVAGIAADFAADNGPKDAEQFLSETGIELVNREVDNSKHYGQAMSIDLFVGGNLIYKAGARGTITENNLMVSRLNNFDQLYLEPTGHHLFVEYKDEPGVIGRIAGILGEKNINIIDIRAPQDLKSGLSLTVVKTNVEVPDMLVQKIREAVKASKAFQFTYLP